MRAPLPCPICAYPERPSIREGDTYRYRIVGCNCCGWGVEVRVQYADDGEEIAAKCIVEWNDRRTWEQRRSE